MLHIVEQELVASILAMKNEGKNIDEIMVGLNCKKKDIFTTYRKNNILSKELPTDEAVITNIKADKESGMMMYQLADKYSLIRPIIKKIIK